MTKHIHVLQPYIQAGKVSLYSTTLPGYDDVQGFGGIELNDAYAEQYFLNHCLYYAKGMASYVTVLHIDEFIIPVEVPAAVSTTSEVRVGIDTDSESKKGTFVQEVVRRFSKVDASNRSAEANGAYSSKDATKHAAVAQSHCTYSLQPAHSSTSASGERMAGAGAGTGKEGAVDRVGATIGTVQAPLWVYGVEDPANVFGAWGPGESSWSRGNEYS